MGGALTETTSVPTEYAGTYKSVVAEINPGSTEGWVVFDELDTVVVALTQVIFTTASVAGTTETIEDNPTVVCRVDGTTSNQVWFQLLEGDGSVNTQNDLDFFVLAIGTASNA